MTFIVNNRVPEEATQFVSEPDQGNKIDTVINYYQHSRLSIYASDVEPSELNIIGGDVDASPQQVKPILLSCSCLLSMHDTGTTQQEFGYVGRNWKIHLCFKSHLRAFAATVL